ncbi:hypothetical protein GobsT_37320 [Gemmata obscuriglobus]|uniref:hypothetical protein n=1 Tax=Gemmata obscuriglobus TaxID=114 RepID=UPI00016C58BB|nr:hypothetical protein [Gemmata obscuriglobus]QEG28943.1 hypothetical protein GobsT_37320 [Gemmata obscuriglobus]VTS07461.1 unnamed protein product [Gemmata obscuriglobus UQM 2246]
MGRVYAVDADCSRGEIQVDRGRLWVLCGTWQRVPMPVRVEFDGDTSVGGATVTAFFSLCGGPVESPDGGAAKVRFRAVACFLQVTPEDPDPHPHGSRGSEVASASFESMSS